MNWKDFFREIGATEKVFENVKGDGATLEAFKVGLYEVMKIETSGDLIEKVVSGSDVTDPKMKLLAVVVPAMLNRLRNTILVLLAQLGHDTNLEIPDGLRQTMENSLIEQLEEGGMMFTDKKDDEILH